MRRKNPIMGIFRFCILLILVLVMLYSGLRILESTVLLEDQETQQMMHQKTIIRNGREYFPRQDITVMMILGIDKDGPAESSKYYRNDGAADSVLLLILDDTNKSCSVLCLNRDTMLYNDMMGVNGEYGGTEYGQLAISHTYGTGMEDSCENVKNTLMNNIHGLNIDYYVSMRMDALPILNDAVGGVTVNVVDDFSLVDPSLSKGEVTLRGDQVLTFVRSRKNVGDQKNLTRMERQKTYVSGFFQALKLKKQENTDFIVNVYEEVAPYLVTDCSVNTLSTLLDKYLEYPLREVVIPQGENVLNDGHYEFYPDEEKLDELIVRLFYAPK